MQEASPNTHFNNICRLTGHAPSLEYEPDGTTFSFETQTVNSGQLFDPAEFAKVSRKSVTCAGIQELDDIDTALDAYTWPHNLIDEEILERLLALNLERAEAQEER